MRTMRAIAVRLADAGNAQDEIEAVGKIVMGAQVP